MWILAYSRGYPERAASGMLGSENPCSIENAVPLVAIWPKRSLHTRVSIERSLGVRRW